MRKPFLWRLSVSTNPESDEAVAEVLQSLFGVPAASYTDTESGKTTVSVFLDSKPEQISWRGDLLNELHRDAAGVTPGTRSVHLQKIRRENWAESWKRHFKPIEFGTSLLVKPGWSKRKARKGQAIIILNPGLSFGTGNHPTTDFCLRQIVAHRFEEPRSFLDLGTGSGILAIAAARLGYSPVHALDLDAEAIQIASGNARTNRVARKIRFDCKDLTRLPAGSRQQFSLVCANLISSILIQERGRILARIAPGGVLVLAGILRKEFNTIQRCYEVAGLRMKATRAQGEWKSGAFTKP